MEALYGTAGTDDHSASARGRNGAMSKSKGSPAEVYLELIHYRACSLVDGTTASPCMSKYKDEHVVLHHSKVYLLPLQRGSLVGGKALLLSTISLGQEGGKPAQKSREVVVTCSSWFRIRRPTYSIVSGIMRLLCPHT